MTGCGRSAPSSCPSPRQTEYDEDGRWLRDLYMDTPDKTTAKRIMQINKDGIAASTTGYEGPYTVGITVDGQILGSWIAANSIDTNQLSIGLNSWIKGTDDGIASKVEKDGIISAINQSSEEVAIQAQRINLNGAITANNYFKIKTDGSMEAIAGQIGGFNINSDYWVAFQDYAFQNVQFAKNFNRRKPSMDHWMNFSIGSSACHIAVSQIQKRNELVVEIYISEDKDLFHSLFDKKDAIESDAGLTFDWRELPERKASRIVIEKSVTFGDKNQWNAQFDWLIDVMLKMKKAFKKYL